VVERDELGDPTAGPEADDVRPRQVEGVEEDGRIGDQVAQGVPRVVRIDGHGPTGVPQVVPHHQSPAGSQPVAELVRPREHRVADQEDGRVRAVPERLDAEIHAVDRDHAFLGLLHLLVPLVRRLSWGRPRREPELIALRNRS